jgi:hypothetical protein
MQRKIFVVLFFFAGLFVYFRVKVIMIPWGVVIICHSAMDRNGPVSYFAAEHYTP